MIVTATYQRNTFRVQAIQVTRENIAELAQWCGGELKTPDNRAHYIGIPVNSGKNTVRAYAGDWITRLVDSDNFRVYKDSSFHLAFKELKDHAERYAEVYQCVRAAMRKQDVATYHGESNRGMDEAADKATRDILSLF